MKKKIPFFFLTAILLLSINKINAQGGTFTPNSSVNGTMSTNTSDQWNLTTTSDGQLQIKLSVSGSTDLLVTLYDNDGATILAGPAEAFGTQAGSLNADGLAPGTYHIVVRPYATTSYGSYTLSNTFTAAQTGNDPEPNGTAASAINLPLNGSKTGHVGYYYNNHRDTADWYKVTTNANGLLKMDLTMVRGSVLSVNPLDVDVTLFDNNGAIVLGNVEVFNGNNPGTGSIVTDGLAPGTYYFKIQPYSTIEFANYTISNTFTASVLANDAEPNGTAATAASLLVNGSSTGQVGYYYNNQRDTADWYKVTTTGNGLLQVTLSMVRGTAVSVNPLDVEVTLFDNNGTTVLGNVEVYNGGDPGTGNIVTDGLAPGTYYIKIQPYATAEFATYTLSDHFVPASLTSDKEPNGTPATAVNLPINTSKTGNVGYFYNAQRDTADWYKVTTNADGLLRVYLSSARGSELSTNALDVEVYLYDNNGTTLLGNTEVFNSNGPASGYLSADGLAAGTYYIKVQPYSLSEFANYSITDSLFVPPLKNDAEPNGSLSSALSFPGNSSITGHVGYYYNNQRDSTDWYKLTTGSPGPITLTLSTARGSTYSNNSLDVNLSLFSQNGSTLINYVEVFNGNGPGTGSFTTSDLPAATYYIKVQPYSTTEFADYTLTNVSNAGSVLKITSVITNAACYGQTGSVSFSATGGTPPYVFYLVNKVSSASQNNSTGLFTGLTAGDYYDSVVDAGKQYATGSVTITQPLQILLPPIVVAGSTTVCSGATVTLMDAVPGGVWSSSDPLLATVSPGGLVHFGTPMGAAQVTIHYVVASSSSCSASTSVTFNVNPPLSAGSISGNTMLCAGKTSSLTDPVKGGVWGSNSVNAKIDSITGLLTAINPGTAIITYAVSSGGCLASTSTTVTITAVPVAAPISGNNLLPRGKTTVLTDATPGGVWTSSNNLVATVSATGMLKGISNGTCNIYYTITNAGGCADSAKKQITVYGIPKVQTSFEKINCFGDNTTLRVTASGGSGSYRYSLNGSPFQSSDLFTVSAGLYFVIVQDNISKLYGFTLVFVSQPLPLGVYVVNQTNAGAGLANGSLSVAGYGGHSPYFYSIDNGATYQSSGSFNHLARGTYFVSIRDGSGCTRLHAAKVDIKGRNAFGKGGDEITGGGLSAHVFPNPAQSAFTLTINADNPQTVYIEVVDLLGRLIYKTKGNTSDTFRFGETFGKGTYFIRIISERESRVITAIKQ